VLKGRASRPDTALEINDEIIWEFRGQATAEMLMPDRFAISMLGFDEIYGAMGEKSKNSQNGNLDVVEGTRTFERTRLIYLLRESGRMDCTACRGG